MKKFYIIITLIIPLYSQNTVTLQDGTSYWGKTQIDEGNKLIVVETKRGKPKSFQFEKVESIKDSKDSIIWSYDNYICEKNKNIKIVMLPISNDYYGLSELLHNVFNSTCFDIKSNMGGLKYLDSKHLLSENINDLNLNEIGKSSGVDYVSHGFAYTIDIPNKSSETSIAGGIAASSIWRTADLTSLLETLPSVISHYSDVKTQSNLAEQAGTYLLVTYYIYNMESGKKEFVYQNTIIKKLG